MREQSPGAAGARIVILSKHVNMITCWCWCWDVCCNARCPAQLQCMGVSTLHGCIFPTFFWPAIVARKYSACRKVPHHFLHRKQSLNVKCLLNVCKLLKCAFLGTRTNSRMGAVELGAVSCLHLHKYWIEILLWYAAAFCLRFQLPHNPSCRCNLESI